MSQACISQLFDPSPEQSIPRLLQKSGRARQSHLQNVLLDEILGPNNENVPRLKQWISEQATVNPKIYAQIVTRLLPPNNDEPLQTTHVQNTLVIIDQNQPNNPTVPLSCPGEYAGQMSCPGEYAGQKPQLGQENNLSSEEPINAAFSIPIKETNLPPKKIKFRIPVNV